MSIKIARFRKLTLLAGMAATWHNTAIADVAADSHMGVEFRNFYMNRNFTKEAAQISEQHSWSQGALLNFQSGYTDTPIALGFDLDGQYAFLLDHADHAGNDGSHPYNKSAQPTVSDYSRAGATLKAKYSKTELRVGDSQPNSPILSTEHNRQLPSVAQGAIVTSNEIKDLTISGGRYWSQVTRESSDHEKFFLQGQTKASSSQDGLDFSGIDYTPAKGISLSYYHAILHDIYKQNYFGTDNKIPLGSGITGILNVRYNNFDTDGDGAGGTIDNHNYGVLAGLSYGGHTAALSYQRMLGDTGQPQLSGSTPILYLVNWNSLGFFNRDERSWSARYVFMILQA